MTTRRDISLIGIPMEAGTGRRGAGMGPDAYRAAMLAETLEELGHRVVDTGNLTPPAARDVVVDGRANDPGLVAAWIRAIDAAGTEAVAAGRVPVFAGGDHALSAGSVNAMARAAQAANRPLAVLWLDAHSDFNTPQTSPSGNIHGMPVAALCREPGLDFLYEGVERHVLSPEAFRMFGIRSVDRQERRALRAKGVRVTDMRQIDEMGTARAMAAIIETMAESGAWLHVSLDVDFLDPSIAPGVGTTVEGGATYREAHLVMEMLADSGLVCSLDLVELNPFMDHAGRSARLMVELVASLFGRSILERGAGGDS